MLLPPNSVRSRRASQRTNVRAPSLSCNVLQDCCELTYFPLHFHHHPRYASCFTLAVYNIILNYPTLIYSFFGLYRTRPPGRFLLQGNFSTALRCEPIWCYITCKALIFFHSRDFWKGLLHLLYQTFVVFLQFFNG